MLFCRFVLKIQHIILSVNSPEVSSSVRPCYVEFSKVHESKQTLNQCYQRWQITTYDRAKAAPLSSPLFHVLLHVFLSSSCMIGDMCLSVCVKNVLCLRGECIFCVTFPAWAFSYILIDSWSQLFYL